MVKKDFTIGSLANDSLGSEGAAPGVAGQVADGGFASSGGLKLDVPWRFWREGPALVRGEVAVKFGVSSFEGGMNQGTEARCERTIMDQELIGLLGADELMVRGVVCDGGNDAVNVRVVLHGTAPGMKDGGDAEPDVGW